MKKREETESIVINAKTNRLSSERMVKVAALFSNEDKVTNRCKK